MKYVVRCVALMVGAGLGVSVGLGLRHAVGLHAPAASGAKGESLTSSVSEKGKRPANKRPDDSPLTTQLAHDLSISSPVRRWLYWWNAIENAKLSDFPRLARLAQGNSVAMRLVAERWAELGPKEFFEALRTAAKQGNAFPWEFANVLFSNWLKQDKGAVIAALNGTENFPERSTWRQQVASALMDTDPEAGLRMMSQWHIENFGPNMSAVKTWAEADPRHAAEFTLANPAGYASQEAMRIIGDAWARSAPAQALEFATSQRGDLSRSLAQTVLKAWAERDLNQAADWLANSDPATLKQFSPSFVEAWAKQDAPSALAWCQSNLSGSTLVDAMRQLFSGAADKDVASAAALVNSMPASTARSQAAAEVADKWFPNTFESKSVPPETISWLSSLDPDSIVRATEKVSWKWTESDPSSLASFLQTTTNVSFPASVYENLARNMARNDPSAALDWTSHLPEQLGLAAGSTAFTAWGSSQFDSAMQWFNQMPSSDPRRQPFLTSLLQDLAWDPQATDRFAQVAAVDPSIARSALKGMALPEDRRAGLLARLSAKAGQ